MNIHTVGLHLCVRVRMCVCLLTDISEYVGVFCGLLCELLRVYESLQSRRGQFDLQNSTYLETGAREDLKLSGRFRLNVSDSPVNAFTGKYTYCFLVFLGY